VEITSFPVACQYYLAKEGLKPFLIPSSFTSATGKIKGNLDDPLSGLPYKILEALD